VTNESRTRWNPFRGITRSRTLRNVWFGTRYVLGSHPRTYSLLRFTPPRKPAMVRPGVDACIEGLPRSGNGFAYVAFLARNPETRVAHHMHVPMQVTRALRLGIPCAVLIREPLANLTSLVITSGGNDLSPELAFRMYIDYFRRLAKVRDDVALCRFEDVLEDPSVVGRQLNLVCETAFNTEPIDVDMRRTITERMRRFESETGYGWRHSALPNPQKDELKPMVSRQLAQHRLFPLAERLYAELS
jgi:hypothetical protein